MGSSTSLLSAGQGEELTERRLTSLCICSKDSKALGKCQSLHYTAVHFSTHEAGFSV